MGKREIIIKVSNDRIFFNPQLSIAIHQTNIPKEHLSFRTHENIYWKVEMLHYHAESQCLKVTVSDYSANDISHFNHQNPKKPVNQLLFDKFDWPSLEPLLMSYQKSQLREVLVNMDANPFSGGSNTFAAFIDEAFDLEDDQVLEKVGEVESEKMSRTIEKEFWIPFDEARFMLGYVAFKKYIHEAEQEVDFKIPNEHILAEFDSIKFWFAKKLKTKKFKVAATITLSNHEPTETKASSKHIDRITSEFIDSVKYQRTFALTKKPRLIQADQSLFTSEDIFSQMDTDDEEGNVFQQTEEDILQFFLENSSIRNKKHLDYLAGKKQSEHYGLRYTLHPNFGFLFFIEGKENNHFVWELLNSHGTYIWSIEKGKQNIVLQFKRIEDIVNNIRANGRENYKRAYRNNHQDNDLVFRVIHHENIGSKLIDGFPKWRSRLNEQLT